MTQAAKAQEPSMEEILASIRRIIADDDAGKAKPPEAARPRAPTPPPTAPIPAPAAPPPRAAAPMPPPPMPVPSPVAEAEPPPADVLDLTEDMAIAPNAPTFRKIEPTQDLAFDEPAPPQPEPEPEPEPPPMMVEPAPPQPDTVELARRQFEHETGGDRHLLSSSTTAAVDAAFNSLANTVLVQNSRTLDDLVREMLRPMLKAWLDDNLPNMVERLVRAEIERVARGRG
jgi:uncharacterized protein